MGRGCQVLDVGHDTVHAFQAVVPDHRRAQGCLPDLGVRWVAPAADEHQGGNSGGRHQQHREFADGVPGGPNNPLGARALYLYREGRDTYYRIHGTTEPWSIGQSVSNGCIRMLNEHVIQLYEQVPVGTPVTVV